MLRAGAQKQKLCFVREQLGNNGVRGNRISERHIKTLNSPTVWQGIDLALKETEYGEQQVQTATGKSFSFISVTNWLLQLSLDSKLRLCH